jgi:hypothetical protein
MPSASRRKARLDGITAVSLVPSIYSVRIAILTFSGFLSKSQCNEKLQQPAVKRQQADVR